MRFFPLHFFTTHYYEQTLRNPEGVWKDLIAQGYDYALKYHASKQASVEDFFSPSGDALGVFEEALGKIFKQFSFDGEQISASNYQRFLVESGMGVVEIEDIETLFKKHSDLDDSLYQ